MSGKTAEKLVRSTIRDDAPQYTAIEKNPFAILEVSTRDDRRKIMEMADDKSLSIDEAECSKARADLTNPRNRLSAEVSWLPGVSPKRAKELIGILRKDPDSFLKQNSIEPLALINLMASALELLDEDLDDSEWTSWILAASETYDQINPQAVMRHINEDRVVSGFPEITAIDQIEKELSSRRNYYNDAIKNALDRLPARKILNVVTNVADTATDSGEKHATHLIDDLIDKYEIETQGHLQAGVEKIEKLIDGAHQAAHSGETALLPVIHAIEKSVREWDAIAQPIQLSFKSRGLDHDLSMKLGFKIRNLAIEITNEHGMLEPTTRLTALLKDVFAELPELSARLDDDIIALDGLMAQKRVNDEIAPVIKLCDEAISSSESEPRRAEEHGQNLFKQAQELLAKMGADGLPKESIIAARDYVAMALVQCAISLGNETSKWESCATLLESAQGLASDQMVLDRINNNLAIVRKNNVLHGKPIGSAPSLYTINGCGFKLYGATDHDRETGSHIATYYFVGLFIPIFPIARYRVIANGNSYRFLGKFPLRTFDKWHLGIALAGIAALFLSNM